MIQIDMEMPKNCINCPLLKNIKTIDDRRFYVCGYGMKILFEHDGTEEAVDAIVEMPKPQWCPLKEVSAIPVEWLKEKARENWSDSWTEVCKELLAEWEQEK